MYGWINLAIYACGEQAMLEVDLCPRKLGWKGYNRFNQRSW